MGSLLRDVRYAMAMMAKKPGFTAAVVAALVLGIGANTAIFSVVSAVLLRPLPYADAARLVRLHDEKPPELDDFPVSPGNFTQWQQRARSFEQVAAYYGSGNVGPPLIVTGGAGPEQLDGARVSASLFPLLGVSPMLGRTFTREEEERGRDRVILLSDALWRRRFGRDPSVVGRTVTITDQSYTVIGVMPASFRFPAETTEAWVPLGFTPRDRTRHGSHYLTVLAKLREGTSIAQAQAEMNMLAEALAREHPESNSGWRVEVVSWQEVVAGPMRTPLLILSAAVLLVLLIACVNVTNLLLARATSRSRELTIRMTLGATRGRVVRQLLTESLLLSLGGGAIGLVLAIAGVKALAAVAPPSMPALDRIGLDAPVLAFTVGVAVLTALVFGLAPALESTKTDLNSALQQAARGSTEGPRRNRLRKLLVVSEVGLALILLVGATLLIRSFLKLRAVDPGLNPDNVLTMNVALSRARYPEDPEQAAFFENATRALAAVPGVTAATAVSPLPFAGDMNYGLAKEGDSLADPNKLPVVNYQIAGSDYFKVMGIPLLRGRTFTRFDREGAPRVAIINQTLARKHFGNADPIGRRIYLTDGSEAWREIVGVVGDVKLYSLDAEATPQVYDPFLQSPFFAMNLAVRTSGDPKSVANAVVAAIHRLDPNQPVTSMRTMDEVIGETMARQRFSTTLLSIFAAVALLLATMGIYAVMAYAVAERTREIGIRMAIGAQPADILRLVVGQGAIMVVTGVAIGAAAALGLTRLMASLLFGVTATDWPSFAMTAAMLVAVALLASYVPARRAARLDPVEAMRAE